MQNFIREFLTGASQFGLHLDETKTGPFKTGEDVTIAQVLDLKETYALILSSGHVLLVDASAGAAHPATVSKTVQTVEELAAIIRVRRAVQAGRWN